MDTTLYNIGGMTLAPCEVNMFSGMLANPEHTYIPESKPSDLDQQTLDILVLEGLIERFCTSTGVWQDAWIITDDALRWLRDPEVGADMELARAIVNDEQESSHSLDQNSLTFSAFSCILT
jgi:hypothetical protein